LFSELPEATRIRPRGMMNYLDPAWHPFYFPGSTLHSLQSITKSIVAVLIGVALYKGILPSLDCQILPYLKGFSIVSDISDRWTLRHLLTMSLGLRWDEQTADYTDPANHCAQMEASTDWVRYVLAQPQEEEPGKRFLYNSGTTMLLGQVLLSATGLQPDEFAQRELFKPLGISHHYWKHTPTGLPDCEGGLYLPGEDLAKFGHLYLQDGVWTENGRSVRLIPEGWVAECTKEHFPAHVQGYSYGYQWWVFREENGTCAYGCLGYGDQRLLVLPQEQIVCVALAWNVFPQCDTRKRPHLLRTLKQWGDRPLHRFVDQP